MPTSRTKPKDIDEYSAAFPPEVQAILQRIRLTIHGAAPNAAETISYQIPAFTLSGTLVYLAAFRKHIGFYPRGIGRFEATESDLALCGRERQSQISARSTNSLCLD